eukprot:Opistho-2@21701
MEDEGLPKNPDLALAQHRYLLNGPAKADKKEAVEVTKHLMDAIKKDNMAPFYEELVAELKWEVDRPLLEEMRRANKEALAKLDATIEDAQVNQGETEVREANLAKSDYLCRIGDKANAVASFQKTFEKTISLGQRLDIIFNLIRLGLFYMDAPLIIKNIEKAKVLIEEGGDWDRRNRLRVYEGLYLLSIRDFKTATSFFLDGLATFTSYELMEYKAFVAYTVVAAMLALPRVDLRKKVMESPEILEALHDMPDIATYLRSLHDCNYAEFFRSLATIEGFLKRDRILSIHSRYYIREMRILSYAQILESYRSLTLESMATSFGVTVDFIDRELSRFIAAGRLNCKIDKVRGIVETNRPDSKNAQYQSAIRHGDLLLNRIQKLSRVINI